MPPPVLTVRKLALFAINLASTFLTLFTGLRENPINVFITGRYDLIRYRLQKGFVSYNHIRKDLLDVSSLPDLATVGRDWRIFSSPTRSPANLGEDRSVCLRVNSMNATMMTMNYNDFWGRGVRREQIYMFSISPPNCYIINFEPSWVTDNCTALHDNDTAKCHRFILDNFDALHEDRRIQVGVEVDFGIQGHPFMKCLGRPPQQFNFMADLIVQQQYWAGGSHVVEVQSSRCLAEPLIRNSDWQWGLFEVHEKDQSAEVITSVDQTSRLTSLVLLAYGVVSLVLIANGIFRAIVQTRLVWYLPLAERFIKDQWFLRYVFPSMRLASLLPHREGAVIRFKGHRIMGSDIWLNHWLYITLSILEAFFSLRMMYVCLEMGTWLLSHKVSFGNFIFLCSALTRITWLMCLVHTLLRYLVKMTGSGLKAFGAIREPTRVSLDRYIDGVCCFSSYKIYSVTLCVILYGFLVFHGGTTFQKPDPPYKRAGLGGDSNVEQLWRSEIVCDLFVIFCFHTTCVVTIGMIMMSTRYRYIVHNSIIRTIQQRYGFVGWDVFLVAELLNMNPFDPSLVRDEVALTNCSFGCILQVLYAATPSGLVDLAGDFVFAEGGFSKEPVKFSFTPKRANELGLFRANQGGTAAVRAAGLGESDIPSDKDKDPLKKEPKAAESSVLSRINARPFFDRTFRVVTESFWGRVIFVDHDDPGRFRRNDAGVNEFVMEDALATIGIRDIKPFLGNKQPLHIV